MEFLSIDDQQPMDWAAASRINEHHTLCIVHPLLKDRLNMNAIHADTSADILHVGLSFFQPQAFERCSAASLNWHFLDPPPAQRAISWKASAHLMVIRKGILPALFPDQGYLSVHVQAADVAYQALTRGATVYHDPGILTSLAPMGLPATAVQPVDESRFIYKHFGLGALGIANPTAAVRYLLKNRRRNRQQPLTGGSLLGEKQKEIGAYTAIIPTVNRYEYLDKAIRSLLENPRPPAEIIVVDQTAAPLRVPNYYEGFSKAVVKVFFLDKAGQCSARNKAILEAGNPWLLLFDDDSIAWPEMVTEHITLLENSSATVSTGISLAPWKDRSYITADLNFYHVSPVLDTGNCFIRKSSIERIGMFDLAFDRGSGADDNLGKRLYRGGETIAFNPRAIRTHYKASTGGLRQHGAWWKNKGTLWGPLPLATESYNFLTFYPRKFYLRLCFYKLITSFRRSGFLQRAVNTILFPWKVRKSYREAQALLHGR